MGLATDLIRTVFRRMGYDTSAEILPWNRAVAKTKSGVYDVLYNAYFSESRARTFAVSDPYLYSPIHFCAKKSAGISYITFRDLRPYKIGVVLGYVNSREFDETDYLVKDPAPTDLHNLKKLISGRVDIIVIDRYVATHLIKTSPFLLENITAFDFLEPALKMMPVYAMFSKEIPGHQNRLTHFNRELRQMRKDGTYEAILEKHGFR